MNRLPFGIGDFVASFKGEAEGHPFRGNQYGDGSGGHSDPEELLKKNEDNLFGPWTGQTRKPKEGVTRPQIEEYYKKKKTIDDAKSHKYSNGKSAKQEIDTHIANGFTSSKRKGSALWIDNGKGESMPLRTKVEQDYFSLAIKQ